MRGLVAGSLLALTVMLVGCGPTSTTPSLAPTASLTAEPTASPLVTPWAEVTASPQASPTPPTTGVFLRSTDPDLEARLPDDWVVIGPTAYEESLSLFMEQVSDPVLHRALEWELAGVTNGQLRDVAVHATGPVIGLNVLAGAGTLEQVVAARRADIEENSVPNTVVSEAPTTDLFLPAYRTEIQSNLASGVPSRTIEYLAVLSDGRVVALNGTAQMTNAGFPNLMTEVARSLGPTGP